jgi:hypothetical protein
LASGGVGSGDQDRERQHPQLGGGQAITAVLDPDQVGQQVVGEVLTPVGDHVIDVVVELTPRLQHDRFLLGEVAVEAADLEDVLGPPGELLPVLAWRAEKSADDRNRVGPGDVCDELAAARLLHIVE